MSQCVYCNDNPISNSEHVFPHGLGGENIRMDCVCVECNKLFSILERELIRNSFVGLMRSVEGVEGEKNKIRTSPLKNAAIFIVDDVNSIPYEAGQYEKLQAYLRTQIIEINSNFFIESATQEELSIFSKLFIKWKANNLILVTEFNTGLIHKHKAIKFSLTNGNFDIEHIEIDKTNGCIGLFRFDNSDEKFSSFPPRLFLDDDNRIHLRSLTINEGIDFIVKLLNYTLQTTYLPSSQPSFSNEPVVSVSMNFDFVQTERAVVKIGLNCLMNYYPDTQRNILLEKAKDCILHGADFTGQISPKSETFDANPETHLISFVQMNEGLIVHCSFFAGGFNYGFFIENLSISTEEGFVSALEVEYHLHKQSFHEGYEYLVNK